MSTTGVTTMLADPALPPISASCRSTRPAARAGSSSAEATAVPSCTGVGGLLPRGAVQPSALVTVRSSRTVPASSSRPAALTVCSKETVTASASRV